MIEHILTLNLTEDEKQLLQEALAEFINNRDRPTVEAYVSKRYADHPQGDEWRAKKVIEVNSRINRAKEIRKRLFE